MFGGSQTLFDSPQGGGSTFVMGETGKVAGGAKKPAEEKVTCLPVTIRSVEVAIAQHKGSGDVLFYGTEPSVLLVVGLVESVNQLATSLELLVNDSTGRLPVRYYTSGDEHELAGVRPGSYVSFAAQLRVSPTAHLSIVTGRLVRSPDEISYHMIESAHAALKLQRILAGLPSRMEVQAMTPAAKRHTPELLGSDNKISPSKTTQSIELDAGMSKHLQQFSRVASPASEPIKAASGLSPYALRCAVLDALGNAPNAEVGLSVSDLCLKFRSSTEADIRAALAELDNAGEIFNTLNDDTFAKL